MTTDEERDLAVLARRKSHDLREIWASVGTIVYARHPKPLWPAMLPEAAFDWPIYRAALAPVVGTFAAIDPTETFEPDGPPDSYWEPIDNSRYRAEMQDAGRGHLLRW
jgi:hypothetical protein